MDSNFEAQQIKFDRLRAIWRLLVLLLIGIPVGLLFLGFFWLFTRASETYLQIIGWFYVVVGGLALLLAPIACGWLLLQILFAHREYILLDFEGFTIHSLRYTFSLKWSDVGRFSVRRRRYEFSFVVFDYFSSIAEPSQKPIQTKKGGILDQYQIKANPLAELLNSWREHHTGSLNKQVGLLQSNK